MMSIFYLTCITFSTMIVNALPEHTFCRSNKSIDVGLRNRRLVTIYRPEVHFSYNIDDLQDPKIYDIRLNNVTFDASLKYGTVLFSKTAAKYTTSSKIRVERETEIYDSNDVRHYCNFVLTKDHTRLGLQPEFEDEIKYLALPCNQAELCKPFSNENGEIVKNEIKYRKKSVTIEQKLQNTVNAISDFIVFKIAHSLTNSEARLPRIKGNFSYPISNNVVNYTVINGTFNNFAKTERLRNNIVTEVNKKVNVDIVYRLTDINVSVIFKLSDRDYNGIAKINVTKIIFRAIIDFDTSRCNASLSQLHILKLGNVDSQVLEGLVFYEKSFATSYVSHIVREHINNIVHRLISYKVSSFNCGQIQEEARQQAVKWAKWLGELVNSYIRKKI